MRIVNSSAASPIADQSMRQPSLRQLGIAAVALVIGGGSDDDAASIAFTAVLGVMVVLGLPLLGIAPDMTELAFGALAGLTVCAVLQVIAATSPLGPPAVQMGTLFKLVRVLTIGRKQTAGSRECRSHRAAVAFAMRVAHRGLRFGGSTSATDDGVPSSK